MARCLQAMEVLSKAYETTRWAKNTRLILEMALIQLSHPKAEETNLLSRVERLEAMIEGTEEMVTKKVPVPEIKETEEPPKPKESPKKAEPEKAVEPAPVPKEGKRADLMPYWADILQEIERGGNPLLSGALRSGEFRVKGETLYLLDLLPMLDTPQNKLAVKQAVKEVCGTEINVVFVPLGQSVPEDAPPQMQEKADPLQEMAHQLSDKINIIS